MARCKHTPNLNDDLKLWERYLVRCIWNKTQSLFSTRIQISVQHGKPTHSLLHPRLPSLSESSVVRDLCDCTSLLSSETQWYIEADRSTNLVSFTLNLNAGHSAAEHVFSWGCILHSMRVGVGRGWFVINVSTKWALW